MDIRTSLNQGRGRNAQQLADQYGRHAVLEKITQMTCDMADVALIAAIELNDVHLVNSASRIILCSGSYPERATHLAAELNVDVDLAETREKILRKK